MALGMNEKRARALLAKENSEAATAYFAQRVDKGWAFSAPATSGGPRGRGYVVCDNGLVSPVNPGKSATAVMEWLASGGGLL